MIVLLGALLIFFSQRIEADNMATVLNRLRGQARLGADLLVQRIESDYLNSKLSRQRKQYRIGADILVEPGIERGTPHLVGDLLDFARNSEDAKQTLRRIHVNAGARRVLLVDLDGALVARSTASASDTLPDDLAAVSPEVRTAVESGSGLGENIRYDAQANEDIAFIAALVHIKTLAPSSNKEIKARTRLVPLGVLVLAAPLTDVKDKIGGIKLAVGFTFLGVLVLLFFINSAVSNYISQPLQTLSRAAERFATGDLQQRIIPTGADEVSSLGASFNDMAAQLRVTITRLAEERAQAEAILTSMVDGVLVTDLAGNIQLMNQTAEQMCSVTEEQVLGKPLSEAVLHFDILDLLQKTLDSALPNKLEVTLTRPVERVVEVHAAPVMVGDDLIGAVIVLYDITHQRRLEQVRRDFVANVSHELRTPVTSIRAMAETLVEADGDDPAMARDFMTTIISESERLTALLDDLLHLSAIESGRRLITPQAVNVGDVIRHVAERVLAPIAARHQRLSLDVPEPLEGYADPDALVQILVNLIDNARKYSPEGCDIRVSAFRDTALRLTVDDDGVGIPETDLERIFERFYRVDKARSRAAGGTGLGLAIVKHLVELHGGWISVQSEVGVGSTFTVTLPLEAHPAEAGELLAGQESPAARPAS
jgi:two-component system phosphate regulon sensor histidine kinase PhoR